MTKRKQGLKTGRQTLIIRHYYKHPITVPTSLMHSCKYAKLYMPYALLLLSIHISQHAYLVYNV